MMNRWILGGAATVLAMSTIVLGAGAVAHLRIAHARMTSLREWNARRCEAFAEKTMTSPCTVEPLVTGSASGARELDAARRAIDAGRESEAAARLARALERAEMLDRRGSLLTTLAGARIAGGALDVVDAHPSLARRPEVVAALARTRLANARRPLESERLRATTAALARVPKTALLTFGATHMRVADAIEHRDGLLLAMQHAARRGDARSCERAASEAASARPSAACASLGRAVETSRRLDRARDSSR